MLIARYRHRLPADYDMDRIRDRVAARAPAWDAVPGPRLQGCSRSRIGGAGRPRTPTARSTYGGMPARRPISWPAPAFRAVVESFGRPRVETWLPAAVDFGPAATARCHLGGDARSSRPTRISPG